jgi:hypothetical protein
LDHTSKYRRRPARQGLKAELRALAGYWPDWVDIAVYTTLFFLFLSYLAAIMG